MGAMFVPSIYRHEQDVPSATWTINHNIGANGSTGLPIVDTFIQENGFDEKIIPVSVKMINSNTVEIEFSIPRAGFAVIIV